MAGAGRAARAPATSASSRTARRQLTYEDPSAALEAATRRASSDEAELTLAERTARFPHGLGGARSDRRATRNELTPAQAQIRGDRGVRPWSRLVPHHPDPLAVRWLYGTALRGSTDRETREDANKNAEGVGFEPTEARRPQRFSRPPG